MDESSKINEWRVAVMVAGASPRAPKAEWIGTVGEYLQANPDTLIEDLRSLLFRGAGGCELRLGGGAAPVTVVRFMPRAKALACRLRELGVLSAYDGTNTSSKDEVELDHVAEECLNFEGEVGVLAEVKRAKRANAPEVEYGPFVLVLRKVRTLHLKVSQVRVNAPQAAHTGGRTADAVDAWTATITEDDVPVYEVVRPTAERARYAALNGFGVVDDGNDITVAGRPVVVVEDGK